MPAALPSGRTAEEVRKSTDAVGNTTKAVTKGYAIGSAGLGALVLFVAYNQDLKFFIASADKHPYFQGVVPDFSWLIRMSWPGLVWRMLPYLLRAMGMTAVGRAAASIVEEVRQFREKPGIMQGKDKPDYGRAEYMLTRAADPRRSCAPRLAGAVADRRLFHHLFHRRGWRAWNGGLLRAWRDAAWRHRDRSVVAISMTSGPG